ncbi:hypothetical protein HK405_009659, partial [Cladochytrium tenue]
TLAESASSTAAAAMSALGRAIAAGGGTSGSGLSSNPGSVGNGTAAGVIAGVLGVSGSGSGNRRNGDTVRVRVATSKRSMVVVLRADATVSDFLDVVSSKILRGFPVGSVVFNPQPVVAAMTRDGYFFDDDDLVKHAFFPDQEIITLTHEELRSTLKTQLDPFFSRPVVSDYNQPRRLVTMPAHTLGGPSPPSSMPLLLGPPSRRPSLATGPLAGVDTERTAGNQNGVSTLMHSPSDEHGPGGFGVGGGIGGGGGVGGGLPAPPTTLTYYGPGGKRMSIANIGPIGPIHVVHEEDPDDLFPDDQLVDGETLFTSSIASLVSGGINAAGGGGDSGTSAAGDTLDGGSVVSGGAQQHLIFLSFARENSTRTAEGGKAVGSCDPFWIYNALKEAGLNVFIDASDREAGESLSDELVEMMLKGSSPLCDHEFKFSRFKRRAICLLGAENKLEFFKTTAVGYMCGGGDVFYHDFTRPSQVQKSLEQLKQYLTATTAGSKEAVGGSLLPSPETAFFKSLAGASVGDEVSGAAAVPLPLVPRRGRIYVSYSWENSLSLVRARDRDPSGGSGTGVCDPRTVARRLRAAGFEVWIDVHKAKMPSGDDDDTGDGVGSGGGGPDDLKSPLTAAGPPAGLQPGQLPETPTTPTPSAVQAVQVAAAAAVAGMSVIGRDDGGSALINGIDLSTPSLAQLLVYTPELLTTTDALTLGLDRSDCVLAFISDEYAESARLKREFHFAHNVLRVPLIPIVVGLGVGALWRGGEVGQAVSKYLNIDATTSDLVGRSFDRLLRTVFKIVASSPPPEGPRREPEGEEDDGGTHPPRTFGTDDDDEDGGRGGGDEGADSGDDRTEEDVDEADAAGGGDDDDWVEDDDDSTDVSDG